MGLYISSLITFFYTLLCLLSYFYFYFKAKKWSKCEGVVTSIAHKNDGDYDDFLGEKNIPLFLKDKKIIYNYSYNDLDYNSSYIYISDFFLSSAKALMRSNRSLNLSVGDKIVIFVNANNTCQAVVSRHLDKFFFISYSTLFIFSLLLAFFSFDLERIDFFKNDIVVICISFFLGFLLWLFDFIRAFFNKI